MIPHLRPMVTGITGRQVPPACYIIKNVYTSNYLSLDSSNENEALTNETNKDSDKIEVHGNPLIEICMCTHHFQVGSEKGDEGRSQRILVTKQEFGNLRISALGRSSRTLRECRRRSVFSLDHCEGRSRERRGQVLVRTPLRPFRFTA